VHHNGPMTFTNGEVSFWYRDIGLPRRRPALPGDLDVDVALVGGGLTSLWTAYYLKRDQPDLRIAVLEKEFAGFGASGRNGGWLTAELPGQARRYAAAHGWGAAVGMQRQMFAAVDEVIEVAAKEGIEADIVKDGVLHVATNPAQERRLLSRRPQLAHEGWGAADLVALDQEALDRRVRIPGARIALWSPHAARIHPARLVRGLADVVEAMGVAVYEGTEVTRVEPSRAVTRHGTVRASYVLRALEGFTADLAGHRRDWLPMNSSMVATAPLPEAVWEEIGWQGAEVLGDEAHSYCYAQRTADGRIAIGGRGVPYRFGSRHDDAGRTQPRTVAQLRAILHQHFPAAAGVPLEHAWSGVLGVPRDWCATVRLDRETGLGWAGGYVGHGVTSTNLAARTMRDLVLGRDTDLTALPWVDRRVRAWEPEPLRWLGVRGLYVAYRAADRHESGGMSGTSPIARVADRISGR
jgi:glycine/D-amino acid oxidase-like deaminating enzyme